MGLLERWHLYDKNDEYVILVIPANGEDRYRLIGRNHTDFRKFKDIMTKNELNEFIELQELHK